MGSPMREEVMVVIRVRIQPLADDVRARHSLIEELFDVKLEGDSLLLYFRRNPGGKPAGKPLPATQEQRREQRAEPGGLKVTAGVRSGVTTRRRRKMKRNRMRTKGWQVAAKITNSNGQIGVVYKPFVDALFGKQLTLAQQRSVVAEILRSNGNDPTEASIEYFLM